MASWNILLVLLLLNIQVILGIFKANGTCPQPDRSNEKLVEQIWSKKPSISYYKAVAFVPFNDDTFVTINDFFKNSVSINCLQLMVNSEDRVMKLLCKNDHMGFSYRFTGMYV